MSTNHKTSVQLIGSVLVLILSIGLAVAQQPSPSPSPSSASSPSSSSSQGSVSADAPVESGEDAGDFTVISSLEFGYRGLSVDGDHNKYQSDLNYKAGPRLFDSSFLLKSRDGKGDLFETFLVTTTGFGADPQ